MALTGTNNRQSCTSCHYGGAFEVTTIANIRVPFTPGIFDELCIIPGSKKDVYKCPKCGYLLGVDDRETIQALAKLRGNK